MFARIESKGILSNFSVAEAERILQILIDNSDQPGYDLYSAVAAFEAQRDHEFVEGDTVVVLAPPSGLTDKDMGEVAGCTGSIGTVVEPDGNYVRVSFSNNFTWYYRVDDVTKVKY